MSNSVNSGVAMRADYTTSCRMEGGSLTNSGSNNYVVSSEAANSLPNQKSDKKAFYSRIPPLGRVGSADKEKKSAHLNASIT